MDENNYIINSKTNTDVMFINEGGFFLLLDIFNIYLKYLNLLIVHIFIYSIKPDTIQKKENLVPNKWSASQ